MAEENKNIKGKINELAVYHTDAYKLAVGNGYKGTLVEWLDSLVGKSAYEIAVMHGFKGTEKEWIDYISANAERAEAAAKRAEDALVMATTVDLSRYEDEGVIVETMPDKTTRTTTFEFDENRRPVKITDGDGNETVLTW